MAQLTTGNTLAGEMKPIALSDRIRVIFTIGFVFRSYLYTIAFSALIAVFLTIIRPQVIALSKPGVSFLSYLFVSLSYGFIYSSTIMLLIWLIKPDKIINLVLLGVIGIFLGMMMGYEAKILILRHVFSFTGTYKLSYFLIDIANGFFFGGGITYFFYAQTRLIISNDVIEEERIKRLTSEKETLVANLKILQAQIEPHFLFNTLSTIASLIDTKPAKGKSMLLDLTTYLRISLSRTLPHETTLNQEIEMVEAYLNIQKIRMEERLNFKIDIPEYLRQQSFPPMLLQPLVENAVKHGLEPNVEGGEVLIRALKKNNRLSIEVADTGLGISDLKKSGVGLANVRERLVLLYGVEGHLIIEENTPRGVRATIEVPANEI